VNRIAVDIPDYKLSVNGIVEAFRLTWAIKTLIAATLITLALKTSDYHNSRRTALKQAVLLMMLLILSVLLVSASSKYQDWVVNHGVLAYSSASYSAQLFAAAIVALLVYSAGGSRLINKLHSAVIMVIVTILLTPVVAITEFHNSNVLATQRNSANKWHAIESMIASGVMTSIPSGSIIYSPEFMQTGGIASMREGYWGAYLRAKHGINIDITGDVIKYNATEYFGQRYLINYQSRPPYEFYNAYLLPDRSSGFTIYLPDYELTGFYGKETDASGSVFRWSKNSSTLSVCNGSNQNESAEFLAKIRTDAFRPEPLTICLLGKCRDYRLSNETTHVREKRHFPPGCSTMTFDTAAKAVHAPQDPRKLYFQLLDANVEK
jgi:hypothetical protein